MIGRISGLLAHKQAPELLVDVQGVGYEVQVSLNTYFELPAEGSPVSLYTHFVVREDAQQLFGFIDDTERSLFRTLIKVSGVGPKLALGILSGMSAADFVRCIRNNDSASLVRLPGVGKKTAERLVVEMKDRLKDWATDATLPASGSSTLDASQDAMAEAESALIALGYKPQDAAKMVSAAAKEGDNQNSESLIRLALKGMVKK
jgi:Holliday junction DNA helicase RuvA